MPVVTEQKRVRLSWSGERGKRMPRLYAEMASSANATDSAM